MSIKIFAIIISISKKAPAKNTILKAGINYSGLTVIGPANSNLDQVKSKLPIMTNRTILNGAPHQ
ncbi:MAG: hypothetical protein CVU54_00500 [Deltaproteobacteria bacterium HGW-Deltaproteobacteria-12]|nr:MAG: hypothetical protein CVU54_00500 [Deltaproteobacteria bacterium HGW-Deltaproteobacteria-12]